MSDIDRWFDSLIRCATDHDSFTTDDVIAQYAATYGQPDSSKPVGGAIVKATMAGFIEKTGEFRNARTLKRVYRSRLRANV